MTCIDLRFRPAHLIIAAVLLCGSVSPLRAQTPLDIRVMNERLSQIEQQLQAVQRGQAQGQEMRGQMPQMQTTPARTGTMDQPLPTDVAGRLQVRVQQLERLVELLTGQVEEARFEVSRLRAEVQQMSNDVAYRLAVLEQATGVSSAVAAPTGQQFAPPSQVRATSAGMAPQPVQTATNTGSNVGANVGGRIEPNLDMPMSAPVQRQPQMGTPQTATPGAGSTEMVAPGVPASQQVQLQPGAELTAPANAGPVNTGNTFGVLRTDDTGAALPPSANPSPSPSTAMTLPPAQQQPLAPPAIQAAPSPGPVATARIGDAAGAALELTALPAGTPKEQYDYAFGILRQADYARAEKALSLFLEANPENELSGNAQYWLGETYYVRGDFEQAAVEFLSGYQTYPASSKGPDNLLKLGLSMARLGQTDGACTALSRLATEYPSANDTIRRRAQTERARLQCS